MSKYFHCAYIAIALGLGGGYLWLRGSLPQVEGERVIAGDAFTDGPKDPHKILEILGEREPAADL